MTIASTANRKQYDGNGVATVFSFPYKFIEEEDIIVILTDVDGVDATLVLTTHYTLSGAGGESGGDVTMLTAPVTNEVLTIYREVDLIQDTDLSNQEAYFLETLENALDYMTMISQQQQEEIDRCVKSSVVEGSSDITVDGIEDYLDDAISDQFDIDVWEETASPAQDTITVTGFVLALELANISVYIDGEKKRTSDLTRTSDTVVTLDSALSGGEEIELLNGSFGSGQAGVAFKALTLVHTDGATELFDPAVNDQYLKQRNFADDGFIDMVKINTDDLIEFGVVIAECNTEDFNLEINDVFLKQRNYADDGYIDLIKINPDNLIVFGADFAKPTFFVDNADGSPTIYSTNYNLHTYLTADQWESIGPTGSGADNIWVGLNGVPTDDQDGGVSVDWLEFRIKIIGVDCATPSTTCWVQVYARKNGGSAGTGDPTLIAHGGDFADSSNKAYTRNINTFKVPVDADGVFEMQYGGTMSTITIELTLVGYGHNY